MSKSLRPYQQEAIDAIHYALKRGVKKMALVLPTGAGKTFTAVQAIKDMGRILWLGHTEELIDQSAEVLRMEFECEIGLIKADKFDIDHQVVMASPQTLYRRLNKLPKDYFDVVVADECDLFGSVTFRQGIEHFTPKLLLGLTATFMRNDNLSLYDIFDEVVFEYTIQKAIKDGYLTKPIAVKVKTSANLDDVHTLAGDFNQQELAVKINTPERNYGIVNKYIEYGQGRQFIAFCTNVEHTIDLCEAFNEKGIDCNYVVGDKELTTDRKGVITKFKNEEILGLTNCNILVAGFDHPDVGCMIMAAPTKSKRRFFQQFGRGMRLKTEKFVLQFAQNVIILDVVDATTKHKLINCDTVDAELSLEEKIFMSDINRQKLMDAKANREAMMLIVDRKEDEVVELYPLPKIPRFKRSTDPASPEQLQRIKKLGFNIEENTFTVMQVNDIFQSQPASKNDIERLVLGGYDVTAGVTIIEAKLALMEMDKRVVKDKFLLK